MQPRELSFTSHRVRCAAWHLPGTGDAPARPCVVMAHGFGGTLDTGLFAFATPFAESGWDVFAFDYRGFGASNGRPRQDVSVRRQREDYHAAVDAARHLPGVDPDRIVLWGTSYSAGHVVAVAAGRPTIAAAVSMTPAADGLASLALIIRRHGVGHLARLAAHGLVDATAAILHRRPHQVPIVGRPGTTAMITVPGAAEAYPSLAGPTWRNEVGARHALEVARNRPVAAASGVRCPVLVQIGTRDQVVPVGAARRMARRLGPRGCLQEYPVDHFDVYAGPWQRRAVTDQIAFLRRVLD
ncbi:alpha/beta hydrolase [Pseudonocardia yuanmonensis]|uniref:alpha/beta hydrolase n=1 Tax=Pseudonocardia yuanmonensis TaxID=1095914 RepID=UPI0031EF1BD1